MPFLLAGLGLLALIFIFRQVLSAEPRFLASLLRGLGLGILGVVALVLALRGLAVLDLPLGGLIVYLVHHWSARGFPGVARVKAWVAGGRRPPGGSSIETATLRMDLDPVSGTLSGEVLAGALAGARLEQLTLPQLRTLLAECAATDPASARLVETYLDRNHPTWREAAAPSSEGRLTRSEALQVLGLAADATPAQIKEAHRRLMTRLHPDQGGTDYLASKINAARDALLDP
jgi:hypothetical protein